MSQSMSFTSLPGEIRNQIYSYLFILPSISKPRRLGDPSLHPGLLSTCRKIHDEGLEILYGMNTFLAHPNLLSGLPRLRLCYSSISSPSLISLISRYHIRVRLDCDPNFSMQQAKEAFSGMDEFTIEVFQAQFGSSDYKMLKLFEGIRGVKNARVYGSVTAFPAYAEWLQNSMMAGDTETVIPFDKRDINPVGNYDMWTVSEKWEGRKMWADWCL